MVEANPSDLNTWGFAASVPVGGTLTWTNMGSQAHSATAADGSFDTGLVQPGASATVTFASPGIFIYHCTPHPWMTGYVVVSAANTSGGPGLAMVEGSISDINSWGFAYSVSAGSSIAWTNAGAQPHTVTANDGSFDTGTVSPGAQASLEFDTPGLYPFECSIHPNMKGNVQVN
jgi:plastocyanin